MRRRRWRRRRAGERLGVPRSFGSVAREQAGVPGEGQARFATDPVVFPRRRGRGCGGGPNLHDQERQDHSA